MGFADARTAAKLFEEKTVNENAFYLVAQGAESVHFIVQRCIHKSTDSVTDARILLHSHVNPLTATNLRLSAWTKPHRQTKKTVATKAREAENATLRLEASASVR